MWAGGVSLRPCAGADGVQVCGCAGGGADGRRNPAKMRIELQNVAFCARTKKALDVHPARQKSKEADDQKAKAARQTWHITSCSAQRIQQANRQQTTPCS